MSSIRVKGGKKISGEITPQGAKNEALQVICAVLLTESDVVISNIPNIIDVNKLIDILKNLGVSVSEILYAVGVLLISIYFVFRILKYLKIL